MTKIGQAAWLCGSLPFGSIITYLEIHLIPYFIRCCPIRETVADPNRWWYTFDTLKRNEWSVMWGPGCQTFLLNPVYSSLEIHYRQVVPYIVIFGTQCTISTRGFDCILCMWSVRCECSTRFYLHVFRHYYNIRICIWFQNVLGYRKVKTVRVYVWIWSYDYPFLPKRFWL